MASKEFSQQVDRVAELLAQRAKRKLGLPRDLRAVGNEPQAAIPPLSDGPPALADWTTLQPVDVSSRAMKMHEIMTIANAHHWQIAVTHFLMLKQKPYLSDLNDPQLDDLLDRMRGYVDTAETGCSLEHYLPAS